MCSIILHQFQNYVPNVSHVCALSLSLSLSLSVSPARLPGYVIIRALIGWCCDASSLLAVNGTAIGLNRGQCMFTEVTTEAVLHKNEAMQFTQYGEYAKTAVIFMTGYMYSDKDTVYTLYGWMTITICSCPCKTVLRRTHSCNSWRRCSHAVSQVIML